LLKGTGDRKVEGRAGLGASESSEDVEGGNGDWRNNSF